MNVFARYESWAESLEVEYLIKDAKRGCQFPTTTSTGPGFNKVFDQLTQDPLMTAIYDESVRNDGLWLSDAEVPAALKLYRYYKEVRNSLVHSDGLANRQLANTSKDAQQAIITFTAGGRHRTGPIPVLAEQDPIAINFLTVRYTAALLRALVFTIDARIMVSTIGKKELLGRWKSVYGDAPMHVKPAKLHKELWFHAKVSTALSIPVPIDSDGPVPKGGRRKWPEASRDAFSQFAVANDMILRI